jgi:hypothetical protein
VPSSRVRLLSKTNLCLPVGSHFRKKTHVIVPVRGKNVGCSLPAVQHPFPLPPVHRMWHNSVAVDLSADSKLLISLYGRIAQLVRALASHAVLACDYDRNPPTKSRQINISKPFRDACHRLSGACLRRLDHNSCTKPLLESLGRLVCQSSVPIEAADIASKKNCCAETVHVSFQVWAYGLCGRRSILGGSRRLSGVHCRRYRHPVRDPQRIAGCLNLTSDL